MIDPSSLAMTLVVAVLSAALSALVVLFVTRSSSHSTPSSSSTSEASSPRLEVVSTFPTLLPMSPSLLPRSSPSSQYPHAHLGVPSATPISAPLSFVAETKLPTTHGVLRVRAYRSSTGAEPLAILAGDTASYAGARSVPVRVHDACLTSEALGSLKCDCAQQLQLALDSIAAEGRGIVIYMPQEGRGIGLANKIAVYSQQERGLDTVEANEILGFPSEARTYEAAAHILLADLGVLSVTLLSNNPHKFNSLTALGVAIEARTPVLVTPNAHSQRYLQVKRAKMGHALSHLHLDHHTAELTHAHAHAHSDLAALNTLVELRA